MLIICLFMQDSHKDCTAKLLEESGGCWRDLLHPIVREAWKNCKRGMFQFWSDSSMFACVVNGMRHHVLCFFFGDSN
jgi:hypothetical protein